VAEGERRTLKQPARWRGALRGPHGCVGADHPLAVDAGLRMIHAGGSAADAAIAMAAVMTVVQPYFSHLGGDLFAMTYDANTGEVAALNASGPAPSSASVEAYRRLGQIPQTGPLAVTLPGCVDGWWQLHQRQGKRDWAGLFEPAAALAAGGFPASRQLVAEIAAGRNRCRPAEFFARTFGHADREGARIVQPELAVTLRAIGAGGREAFYSGPIAGACRAALAGGGAIFTAEEWQGPGRWGTPVRAAFAGHTVHTQPLPSQGFVLPLALRVYEGLLGADAYVHDAVLQHAALASAFGVRYASAGDPDFCGADGQAFVDEPPPAASAASPVAAAGDTTSLLAVDGEGNAVSLIQSVYAHWGSGVWVPETGVLMNNRMTGFSLEPGHPNELAPGKRPVHTLHCYIVTGAGGELRVVGGTPGAIQQPQTNLQVLDAILRRGEDAQDAVDLPRWSLGSFAPFSADYGKVLVEEHEPDGLTPAFRDAGLAVERAPAWAAGMGRAYVALVGGDGVAAAADPRGEGLVAVF
jgi:gamma-glutamyltranspeptidase/glutathione hydrolase